MKYMITGAEVRGESDSLDVDEINRRVRFHQKTLDDLLRARVRGGRGGLINVSVGLGPTRDDGHRENRGGKHLRIDGPYPETKELVGGFDIIDFDSYEEAIEYANMEGAHESFVTRSGRFASSGGFRRRAGRRRRRFSCSRRSRMSGRCSACPRASAQRIVRRIRASAPNMWRVARCSIRSQDCGSARACKFPSRRKRFDGKNGGRLMTDWTVRGDQEVAGGFNLVACRRWTRRSRGANKIAASDAIRSK